MGSHFDGSQSGPFAGNPRVSGWGPGAAGGSPSGFLGRHTPLSTDFLASYSPGLLPGAAPGRSGDGQVSQVVRDLPRLVEKKVAS